MGRKPSNDDYVYYTSIRFKHEAARKNKITGAIEHVWWSRGTWTFLDPVYFKEWNFAECSAEAAYSALPADVHDRCTLEYLFGKQS